MDDSGLQMASKAFVVPFLLAVANYVAKPQRSKGEFLSGHFSRAVMRYGNTPWSQFYSFLFYSGKQFKHVSERQLYVFSSCGGTVQLEVKIYAVSDVLY